MQAPTPPPPGRYHLRMVRLPNGERFSLLCQEGLPLYSPTGFALNQRDTNRAQSTIVFKLRVIGHFLVWCDDRKIDWEERFQSGRFFTNAEIAAIKSWMRLPIALDPRAATQKAAQNNRVIRMRVTPATHTTRMLFLGQFLRWYGERATYAVSDADFQDFLVRWDAIRPKDSTDPKPLGDRWGLTPEQCELFLEVIHPNSPRNPFEPGMRVRNYAQMILLFDHGLRVAESLMLRTDDLKSQKGDGELGARRATFLLAERRHDPYDTRARVPSPKLQHHRSASPRLLIMTSRVRQALIQWLDHDRRDEKRFPGALKSPYVFVSERGKPLSLRRTNSMFQILEEAFPALGPRFSPHILRHTYVERYFAAHQKMTPDDLEGLLWTTGWVPNTAMLKRYAKRGICERAGKASQELSEARQAATNNQLLAEGWDPDTMPF